MSRRAWTMVLLFAASAWAGCLGGDDPDPTRSFSASAGLVSDGYAYDGTGLVQAGASLEGTVDESANTGNITANFEAWNSTWTVTQDTFSGQEDFKEGGVVFGLVEHGDTGVSTPEIPRIDGEVVTYGTGTVLRDGAPYSIGESSGPWSIHLMLSEDSVRGPDGLIAKADGSTPYDPGAPGDARIIEDDPQGLLKLVAPSGDDSARAPVEVNQTYTFQGPNNRETLELDTGPYASATISVATRGTGDALAAGNITAQIVDQNGTEIDGAEGTVTPNSAFSATLTAVDASGPTRLVVSGNGAYEVDVTGEVAYDDHPFIIVTWDDYTID